jgi:hypothetical protein
MKSCTSRCWDCEDKCSQDSQSSCGSFPATTMEWPRWCQPVENQPLHPRLVEAFPLREPWNTELPQSIRGGRDML